MSLDGEVSAKLRLVSPVTVDDGSLQSKSGLAANAAGGAGGGSKPGAAGAAGISSDLKLSQLQVPVVSRRRKFSSQTSSTSSIGESISKKFFEWKIVLFKIEKIQ